MIHQYQFKSPRMQKKSMKIFTMKWKKSDEIYEPTSRGKIVEKENLNNLLLYQDKLSFLTSMSALGNIQLNDKNSSYHNYICNHCLSRCQSPRKFFHDLRFCIGSKASQATTWINLPEAGSKESIIKFTNHKAKILVPLTASHYFECMFQPLETRTMKCSITILMFRKAYKNKVVMQYLQYLQKLNVSQILNTIYGTKQIMSL